MLCIRVSKTAREASAQYYYMYDNNKGKEVKEKESEDVRGKGQTYAV